MYQDKLIYDIQTGNYRAEPLTEIESATRDSERKVARLQFQQQEEQTRRLQALRNTALAIDVEQATDVELRIVLKWLVEQARTL